MWPPDPISVASQEQRRHPRGSGDRSDSALQRRQALFEHRHGRVGDPAVDVALALEIEESRLRVRRRGTDRTWSGRSEWLWPRSPSLAGGRHAETASRSSRISGRPLHAPRVRGAAYRPPAEGQRTNPAIIRMISGGPLMRSVFTTDSSHASRSSRIFSGGPTNAISSASLVGTALNAASLSPER